jgi:hypothetical protein
MAKTSARRSRPVSPAKPVKPPRGRPPRPGGPTPQAEIQRAYRARLKAAGKIVAIVDADVLADQTMFQGIRERLHAALSKLELREQDVARLTARNAYLENELKRVEQHNTNALKEIIVLKQQATAPAARVRPRSKSQAKSRAK